MPKDPLGILTPNSSKSDPLGILSQKKNPVDNDSANGSTPSLPGGMNDQGFLDPTEHDVYAPAMLTQQGRAQYVANPKQFEDDEPHIPVDTKDKMQGLMDSMHLANENKNFQDVVNTLQKEKADPEKIKTLQQQNDEYNALNPATRFERRYAAVGGKEKFDELHAPSIAEPERGLAAVGNLGIQTKNAATKFLTTTLSGLSNLVRNGAGLVGSETESQPLYNEDGSQTYYAKNIDASKDGLGQFILGLNGITHQTDDDNKLHALPDTFLGNVSGGIANFAPDIAATALIPEAKLETAAEVAPSAIAKVGKYIWNPFTKLLIAKGFLTNYADANEHGASNGSALVTGTEGAAEGAVSGATMGLLGGLAGNVSEVAMKSLVDKGLVKAGGVLTNGTLKVLANSTIFGGESIASSLLSGKTWDEAIKEGETQAGIGAVFGIKEGFGEAGKMREEAANVQLTDQQIKDVINARQVNALRNFQMATPQAITEAHTNPTEIGDLNAKAIEYADQADKENDPDKKSQLTLLAQTFAKTSDVKGVTDLILNNKEELLSSIQASELPDTAKKAITDKIEATSNALHPDEIANRNLAETKTQLATVIDDHKANIDNINADIANTPDEAEKQQKYLQLNNVMGEWVKAQTDLFKLTNSENNALISEQSGTDKFVNDGNQWTHLTNHREVVDQILNEGHFIGKGEDLANFTKDVSEKRFNITKENGGSPYFQKGKFYGNPFQKYLVVAEGDEKFTPNINRANAKSFESTGGVGVLNPEFRDSSHLTVYEKGEDGEYYKIKTSEKPAPKKRPAAEIKGVKGMEGTHIVGYDEHAGEIKIRDTDGSIDTYTIPELEALGLHGQPLLDYFGGKGKGLPPELVGTDISPSKAYTFKTSKGSTYQLNEDGSTIRDKAERNDAGHKGDSGIQEQSKKTYFVTPEDADKLGEIQAIHREKRKVDEYRPGVIGVKYESGDSAGAYEHRTLIGYKSEPEVGLVPVELFNDGGIHFGNKISEVNRPDKPGSDPSTDTTEGKEIEIPKGIENIFKAKGNLISSIGSISEYKKYVENIFPNSKVQHIVYHASDVPIETFRASDKGIYFSEDSKYWPQKKYLYAAKIDIKNPVYHNTSFVEKKPVDKDGIIWTKKAALEFLKDEDVSNNKDASEKLERLKDLNSTYEAVVFDPSQIHILGNKKDSELFEKSHDKEPANNEFEQSLQDATDPKQVAAMYDDHLADIKNNLDIDGSIADYNGRMSRADFERYGDKSHITTAIARNYFDRKNTEQKYIPLDIQADEINERYFDDKEVIGPEDIVDFAVRHPQGHDSYFTPAGNEKLEAINDRYKELTGKNLNKRTARKYAEEYHVSRREAEAVADNLDTPENNDRISRKIAEFFHNESLAGDIDPVKLQEEFNKYLEKQDNIWNIFHPLFEGELPDERDIEIFKSVLNETSGKQGQAGEPVEEVPTEVGSGSAAEQTAQEGTAETERGGYNASTTEPERVRAEYDTRIDELDDEIEKANREFSNAQKNINQNNDMFSSSGVDDGKKTEGSLFNEPANVSQENVDRILKPISDKISRLKSDREVLLDEQEKAIDQAMRQSSMLYDQARAGGASGKPKLNPEETGFVQQTMKAVFPNIETRYYDHVADFEKELEKSDLKNTLSRGSIVHAFVDKNRVIHFNPLEMGRDTPIHEQGHILTSWARTHAPDLYKEMLRAGSEMTRVHEMLKANGYDLNGHALHEEAFVTALGRDGAKKLKEIMKNGTQRSGTRKLIQDVWNRFERWVTEKTGYSLSKGKSIKDMSFGEFVDLMNNKYLLSDTKISDLSSEELARKTKDMESNGQASAEQPLRDPGESLKNYAKRVAEWRDNQIDEQEPTPPENIIGSAPDTRLFDGKWHLPEETKPQAIERKLQDYMNRQKVTQKEIEKAGGKIDESTDFYNHQRRSVALTEYALDQIQEDLFKSKDKKNPSLFEKMKAEGIDDTDFGRYLYAKHAGERNAANAAERQDAYNKEHDRLQKRLDAANDKNSKRDITYYGNRLKDLEANKSVKYPLMEDGGSGMTNQQAKDILAKFEADGLTPKLEELAAEFKEKVTGKQLLNDFESGRISKEEYDRLNEKYKYYVPLQVEEHVNGKNTGSSSKLLKVMQAFKQAKGAAHRDFNQRINPAKYGAVQLEKSIIEGEKNKTLNTLRKLVEENPNPAVWEIVRPRFKVTYNADGSIDKLDEITDAKVKRESMYGFEEGKPFYIHIKDDILRRAVKKEGIQQTWQALNSVIGLFRNTATIYNPAFWAKNIIKDNFSAVYNLNTKGIDKLATNFEKSIPSSLKGVYQYEKGVRDTPEAKMFERYLASGARVTYSRYELDTEKLAKMGEYFENLHENKYNPVVMVKKLGEYMGHVSELLELTTRVSAFTAAIKSGVPDHEAAIISKEATIDFAQKGEWSSIMNSLYLFSNAGIQGSTTFFKNFANNPKAASKVIGGMVAAGILAAAYNHRTNGNPEDDKSGASDWKDYFRVNDYEKQGNLLIRNPLSGGFIKIPTGHELGLYGYLGDKLYNAAIGKEKGGDAALDVAKYGFQAYTPFQGSTLMQMAAPNILKPGFQLEENKNSFGAPIYNEAAYNSNTPQSQLHFANTHPIYVNIADKLHKLTGGTGAENGAIEIPPEAIKFAFETITGGAGKTASQAVDALANSVMLKPTEVRNIPILYSFYTQGNDKNYKGNIAAILKDSRKSEVNDIDRTRFYNDAMKAVLKREISDSRYESMIKEFQKNQERINLGKRYPNATPDELKEMMK